MLKEEEGKIYFSTRLFFNLKLQLSFSLLIHHVAQQCTGPICEIILSVCFVYIVISIFHFRPFFTHSLTKQQLINSYFQFRFLFCVSSIDRFHVLLTCEWHCFVDSFCCDRKRQNFIMQSSNDSQVGWNRAWCFPISSQHNFFLNLNYY